MQKDTFHGVDDVVRAYRDFASECGDYETGFPTRKPMLINAQAFVRAAWPDLGNNLKQTFYKGQYQSQRQILVERIQSAGYSLRKPAEEVTPYELMIAHSHISVLAPAFRVLDATMKESSLLARTLAALSDCEKDESETRSSGRWKRSFDPDYRCTHAPVPERVDQPDNDQDAYTLEEKHASIQESAPFGDNVSKKLVEEVEFMIQQRLAWQEQKNGSLPNALRRQWINYFELFNLMTVMWPACQQEPHKDLNLLRMHPGRQYWPRNYK